MKSKFKDLRIVDNFYQTSAFFPMPLTLIGTLDENGETSYGAYSLIFPYYIAGKDYYAMVLECRNPDMAGNPYDFSDEEIKNVLYNSLI